MAEQDAEYQEARKRVEARLGFLGHLTVYVVINVVFLIVVGWDFLWATVFWGIGLVGHAYSVFWADSGRMRAWKEQQIAKEIARGRGGTTAAQPTQPMAPAPPSAADAPTQPIEE
ncbi:MAG TPA: 2TM domain-containing protein [Acidimicrobiia bacterium]